MSAAVIVISAAPETSDLRGFSKRVAAYWEGCAWVV
jgi:hypothetical protein